MPRVTDDPIDWIKDEIKRLRLLNPDWDFLKCHRQVQKEHPELFPPSRSTKRYTRHCVVCGAEFTRSRSDAETCSPLCRKRKERHPLRDAASEKAFQEWSRQEKAREKIEHQRLYWCVVCDKEFQAFHEAKTCSPRCRKALQRSPAGHLLA